MKQLHHRLLAEDARGIAEPRLARPQLGARLFEDDPSSPDLDAQDDAGDAAAQFLDAGGWVVAEADDM